MAKGILGGLKGLFQSQKEELVAVNDINFSIKKGERVAFIGPNGAGKSTTIKMMAGILFPTSGEIKAAGLIPHVDRKELAFKLGTVFGQKSQLWQHLPAISTFTLLSKVYELTESNFQKRIKELSSIFQIESFIDRPVRKLSSGQRMRCEIVASLVHQPEILFLDEPTIGLDVSAKAIIRDLIKRISEEHGTTVLLTSHDTGDMERVCDRVLMINRGELLFDDSISNMRTQFIRKKLITLQTAEETLTLDLPGLKYVERTPHKTSVEIDTQKIGVEEVIVEALKKTKLRDLTVQDPLMEEIVQAIYQQS